MRSVQRAICSKIAQETVHWRLRPVRPRRRACRNPWSVLGTRASLCVDITHPYLCELEPCILNPEPNLNLSIPARTASENLAANVYAVMSPGACRLNSKTNDGVKNVDFTQVSVSTVAQCKSLCDEKPACLAVEVRDDGYHCELWTKLPKFTSGTESTRKFSCHRKQKPATGLRCFVHVWWNCR